MMLFREPLKASFGVEGGVFILMVSVIGGLQWMPTARLVRGEVLTVKSREFITAANALGSRDGRILRWHILPNVMSPVIVAATFSIASRHHHRIGAVLPRPWLPARFPHLGPPAL